jgi:hypothetical protein
MMAKLTALARVLARIDDEIAKLYHAKALILAVAERPERAAALEIEIPTPPRRTRSEAAEPLVTPRRRRGRPRKKTGDLTHGQNSQTDDHEGA